VRLSDPPSIDSSAARLAPRRRAARVRPRAQRLCLDSPSSCPDGPDLDLVCRGFDSARSDTAPISALGVELTVSNPDPCSPKPFSAGFAFAFIFPKRRHYVSEYTSKARGLRTSTTVEQDVVASGDRVASVPICADAAAAPSTSP
jgi:hypothetical protein